MTRSNQDAEYLEGQLLIAMPTLADPNFSRTVIYMCAHSAQGAMGLVVNKVKADMSFDDLLERLEVDTGDGCPPVSVHFGGPVEEGRGFVLHSGDYQQDSTISVGHDFALTATVDILRSIATGDGPRRSILALGYAGWGPGQLDMEIQQNGWLHAPADPELVFDLDNAKKWDEAVRKLGIDPSFLSMDAGRA